MCILLYPLWQTINEKIERLSIDKRYWFCKWEISHIKYCSMTYNFTIKCAYVVVWDHSKNNYAQRTHGVIITSLLRRFWRYNDVIITSCVSWVTDICETRADNKRQWSSDGSHTVGLLMKIRNEANQVFLRKTYTLVQLKCYQWREMAWNCLNVMTKCFIGHLIIVRLENKCLKWRSGF